MNYNYSKSVSYTLTLNSMGYIRARIGPGLEGQITWPGTWHSRQQARARGQATGQMGLIGEIDTTWGEKRLFPLWKRRTSNSKLFV